MFLVKSIYILFFALTIVSALMVVFLRHAVYSALSLIVTMISIAGIFILINAQLAAILQILIYAGAIMVVFIFVIMLLNLRDSPKLPLSTRGIRMWGLVFLEVLIVQLIHLGWTMGGSSIFKNLSTETASIGEVALHLQTRYLYAFEMTSVLLLIAVVGAMILGRRSITEPAEGQTRS